MSQRRSILHAVVFLCVSASLAVAAEPAVTAELPAPATTPLWDLAAEGQLAFSLQRLGMLADLELRAKRTLYLSDSEFFRDNFLSVGLTTQLAPIFK